MNPPKRWSESGEGGGSFEMQARELFTSVGAQPIVAPSPEALSASWQTAQAKVALGVAGSSALAAKALAVGLAAFVVIGGGAIWWSMRVEPRAVPVVVSVPEEPHVAMVPPVVEEPPRAAPKPVVAVVRPQRAPPATPAEAKEQGVEDSGDAQLVLQAATLVRESHAAQARTMLQERDARYGRSPESGPAALVEIEALRLLGKFDEAIVRLDWLEREQLFPSGRMAELPLIRAELQLAGGHCDEARNIFERLATTDSPLASRARAGLAACDDLLMNP